MGKLNEQQTEITGLKRELERANQANQLLPEKQSFDNANSEYKKAAQSLQENESQLAEETQRKAQLQKDYEKREKDYTEAVNKEK